MTACIATMAEYLRVGIEVGLVELGFARAWADAMVEGLPEPPGEIIEVALSNCAPELLTNLRAVPGERDSALAGRWLLGLLRDSLPPDDEPLDQVVQQSMLVCVVAELDEATCHRFNVIDDQLSLARTGAYGSIAACRAEFIDALAEYPTPPQELRPPNVYR